MKKYMTIILLTVLALLLVGCSTSNSASDYSFSGARGQGVDTNEMYLSNVSAGATESLSGGGRYVIAEARMYLQTKQYENFSNSIEAKLKDLEGFIESKTEENYDSGRLGTFTIKVPSEKLDEFTKWISENATVITSEISRTDVTDELIETGSRKKALEAEEAALLAILEKAETIDEIIKVQDRISDVRSELESYLSKLQQLNNQVKYSTLYIDLREVDRITTPSQSFASLAGSDFLASVNNIGAGFFNFAVWFVGVTPYLILIAIVLIPAVVLTRRSIKRRKAKKLQIANSNEVASE